MRKFFLGIDTSNYTTSLSLVCDGKVIANVRELLPVKEGERGLRQSDAVFLHTKALPHLSEKLFSSVNMKEDELCAVGVSEKPRDAKGSYMPCFLAGISFACGIAYSNSIPLYSFSHQCGHIEAAIYSCEKPHIFDTDESFISFHISGGTTEALLTRRNSNSFDCEIIGGTSDASCGQIIDRAGVMMGMGFPCGKELDGISSLYKKELPTTVSCKDGFFSMSGLENKVKKYLCDGEEECDIAHFLFSSIAKAIKKSTENLRERYGSLPVLYAGGVTSNATLRNVLSQMSEVYFASKELSSDNACGTALLAYRKYTKEKK